MYMTEGHKKRCQRNITLGIVKQERKTLFKSIAIGRKGRERGRDRISKLQKREMRGDFGRKIEIELNMSDRACAWPSDPWG